MRVIWMRLPFMDFFKARLSTDIHRWAFFPFFWAPKWDQGCFPRATRRQSRRLSRSIAAMNAHGWLLRALGSAPDRTCPSPIGSTLTFPLSLFVFIALLLQKGFLAMQTQRAFGPSLTSEGRGSKAQRDGAPGTRTAGRVFPSRGGFLICTHLTCRLCFARLARSSLCHILVSICPPLSVLLLENALLLHLGSEPRFHLGPWLLTSDPWPPSLLRSLGQAKQW